MVATGSERPPIASPASPRPRKRAGRAPTFVVRDRSRMASACPTAGRTGTIRGTQDTPQRRQRPCRHPWQRRRRPEDDRGGRGALGAALAPSRGLRRAFPRLLRAFGRPGRVLGPYGPLRQASCRGNSRWTSPLSHSARCAALSGVQCRQDASTAAPLLPGPTWKRSVPPHRGQGPFHSLPTLRPCHPVTRRASTQSSRVRVRVSVPFTPTKGLVELDRPLTRGDPLLDLLPQPPHRVRAKLNRSGKLLPVDQTIDGALVKADQLPNVLEPQYSRFQVPSSTLNSRVDNRRNALKQNGTACCDARNPERRIAPDECATPLFGAAASWAGSLTARARNDGRRSLGSLDDGLPQGPPSHPPAT